MEKIHKKLVKEYVSIDTQSLVAMGLLIAINIVLSRFVTIQAWNLRIGFGFLPIVIAAITLGPIKTGTVAAIADVIGATLFPAGTFFPGFTLTAFLIGVVYGVFLYRDQNKWKVLIAVGIHQCILSLFLNTLWLSILYGSPYWLLLTTRLMQTAIMIPIELVCIGALCNRRISRLLALKNQGGVLCQKRHLD